MGVRVRLLREEADLDGLLGLAALFHEEGRYRGFAWDGERVGRMFREGCLADSGHYGVIVAEMAGRGLGFVYCTAGRLYFCDCRVASALALYVAPDVRGSLLGGRVAVKLLHAYRNWARARGVAEIQVHVTHGFNLRGVDKLLRKAGFRQTGGNYSMTV